MRTQNIKISILLFLIGIFLNGCTTNSEKHIQGQIQELSIPGLKFVDGKFRANPGFFFEIDKDTGRTVLKQRGRGDPVALIDPCDCILLGQVCDQGLTTDPDSGDVVDVWCTNCGVCLGGASSTDGNFSVKVNFVSGRKCKQL